MSKNTELPPAKYVGYMQKACLCCRRGLERLLRRLVAHPAAPGLLYLHYWPAARPGAPSEAEEAVVDVVLGYYDVPTLSLRAALKEQLAAAPELLELLWKPPPDARIHPTCIGARSAFNPDSSLD